MPLSSTRQLHDGPLTAAKNLELVVFDFRVNGTSDPDGLVQAGANVIEDITYAAGVFTVQFTKNYPRQILGVQVSLSSKSASVVEDAVYDVDSYDADAGTFTISGVTDDGDGTYTVEALTDNGVIHVVLYAQGSNLFVEADAAP